MEINIILKNKKNNGKVFSFPQLLISERREIGKRGKNEEKREG